jgi:beta-lactamase regulating signal transducer with metallopeptidase domain
MTDALVNHLWQSTLCALFAALLALAFRKNGAKVRFFIWFVASMKFLVPFSLFVWVGKQLRWEASPVAHAGLPVVLEHVAEPAALVASNLAAMPSASAAVHADWHLSTLVISIWLLGSVVLLCRRVFQWLYLSAVVKAASAVDIEVPLPVRETPSTLEPGLFGIFSPTLVLPAGIAGRLGPAHLDAILAHELCHWRRRDNLTAALHMLVEALFWFHPLVWWIGGRLVVERERACDEAVIQSGSDRHAYAEGILRVCQHYVEPPVCAAGVSGGTLRKRIEDIMTNPVLSSLPLAKKLVLGIAAFMMVAGPLGAGLAGWAGVARAAEPDTSEMKHYRSNEWKFELDIPRRWVAMPPVPSNSPGEVMRFASEENGRHLLIVFRQPGDPKKDSKSQRDAVQQVLAKAGFSNFIPAEITVGSRRVLTLDFERVAPDGSLWSCRHYFVGDGTLRYTLGFGTNEREAMFDLYDRMAKSFVSDELEARI